mgnify:CR=1 FL=1
MPEIAAAQTAADMTYAKPHAFMPTGGSNRRAARMQAAALRWLVRMAALLTAAVLVFLIGYILVMGIPNLKPELFAWEYNSENVSLTPALINTVLMTAFSLAISTPLGIFAAIWLVEYAHRGSKLVKVVRVTTETLQGIPSIVYGLFGMLFFVTKLHWGYSMIAGAFTLAIMVLPVIMRTTEEALIAVPDSYREGSFGLGAGKLRTVFTIVLPSAMPGILSGVILATGGFDSNPAMLKAWCRAEDIAACASWCPNEGTTGDGQLMGLAVGGQMDPLPAAIMNFDFGSPDSFYASNLGITALVSAGIMINEQGRRFASEGLPFQARSNAITAQRHYGTDTWRVASTTQLGANAATILEKLEPFKEKGWAFEASSLDELAGYMNVSADTLKAEVARFNALAMVRAHQGF